ncbi:MAG TPA: hypothetical protein VJA21_16125, partial [Verrucomicrobiae bacterium]
MVALLLALCASSFTLASPRADVFYVATDGNDAWSGKLAAPNHAQTDGPFASLAAARDFFRAHPANRSRP